MERLYYTTGKLLGREGGSGFFRLRIRCPEIASKIQPGQFINLYIPGAFMPLPRPFSLHRFPHKKGWKHKRQELEILFRVRGVGTEYLSKIGEGELVTIMGPSGRIPGWDTSGRTVILIAGGMGMAPLYAVAQKATQEGRDVLFFFGARNTLSIPLGPMQGKYPKGDGFILTEELKDMGCEVLLALEGGEGDGYFSGSVTRLFERWMDKNSGHLPSKYVCIACGPEGMLFSISRLCHLKDLPLWVFLEERMCCGTGVCLSCVREAHESLPGDSGLGIEEDKGNTLFPGHLRVCTEGPVFNARWIKWGWEGEV